MFVSFVHFSYYTHCCYDLGCGFWCHRKMGLKKVGRAHEGIDLILAIELPLVFQYSIPFVQFKHFFDLLIEHRNFWQSACSAVIGCHWQSAENMSRKRSLVKGMMLCCKKLSSKDLAPIFAKKSFTVRLTFYEDYTKKMQ